MKLDDIKALGVDESTATQISEAFNVLENKVQAYENQVASYNTQLESLKNAKSDDSELLAKIEKLTEANEASNKELGDLVYKNAIVKALGSSVYDIDIVSSLLDRNKIVLDGNNVSGLDEQLKSLKTDKPFLFKSEETNKNVSGTVPPTSSKENQSSSPSAEDFGKKLAENKIQSMSAAKKADDFYFRS